MGIDQISQNLQTLNASAAKPVKAHKPAAVLAKRVAPVVTSDEMLQINAARIIAAFHMEDHGVSVEAMVQGVKTFEKAYEGTIQ